MKLPYVTGEGYPTLHPDEQVSSTRGKSGRVGGETYHDERASSSRM